MNKRTLSIVQDINRMRDELTITSLADTYDVTTRTVRNDITAINKILDKHDLGLLSYGRGGVVIKGEDFSEILQYLDSGDFYQYKLSKSERKMVAAALLINSTGYLTLATIADTLYVSRSTIINDLDGIKAYIKEGNLEVLSHPNKGLLVSGTERDKRAFLMRISQSMKTEDVPGDVGRFISVEAGNKVTISKIVLEQEVVHERVFNDESFLYVVRYLGILVNRNLQGEYIEPSDAENDDYYMMALDILKYITQYCGFTTTEDEIRYLSRILSHQRYEGSTVEDPEAIKVQLLTRRFIGRVSEELGIDLTDDYEFFEALANHLISFFSSDKPYLDTPAVVSEVVSDHPDVTEVVRDNIASVSSVMSRDLEEPEIGYVVVHVCAALERKKNREVAFHVVVACHAGIGTSHLLVERLKKHFNFQIVDIISAHEARGVDPTQADLIIATVPLKNCKVEWVVVSPLLSDEDYLRVGNKIDTLRSNRNLPTRIDDRQATPAGLMELIVPVVHEIAPEKEEPLVRSIRRVVRSYLNAKKDTGTQVFAPCLHHLLTPDHIQLDVTCSDWRDAVRMSAARLLEQHYIEERYIDAIIANIEENGPYVVLSPGFAVPHDAPECGTVKMGMNLIRLAKPVEFGSEDFDPVEFVCCLSATDHKTHLKAFFNLVNLLQKPGFKDSLRACSTPLEMSKAIERAEYALG